MLLLLSLALNAALLLWAWRRLRPRTTPTRLVRETILKGIQDVSELAAVRERFQSIVSFSEGLKVLGVSVPGTTRRFMLRYTGVIVCGCDLTAASVQVDGERVRIAVPHSRVLDVYADVRSFEVYDQSAGIFTSIRLEDQNREVAADLEAVRRHAIGEGILERADENARRLLAGVASGAEVAFLIPSPAAAIPAGDTDIPEPDKS